MKGFKIAFIICFALSGFFFLTGCIFPPLFVMFVFTLAGGIVFSSIYRKTSRNHDEEVHAAEAVEPEAASAVEAVETVTAVEAVEAVEAAPVAAGWTCSCGTVVTDGNFCPSCGAAKSASEAPVATEAAEATDAAPCESPIPTSSVNEQGLEVIDLGIDVPAQKFVDTAIEQNCQVICCSALLTTTMDVMADVVKAAEAAGIHDKVKIMVGGAPVNEEFCQKICADVYTSDAASAADAAVALCNQLNG